MHNSNGDTNHIWRVDGDYVHGIGSYHKTLPHNEFGEVDSTAFAALVAATRGDGRAFAQVPSGQPRTGSPHDPQVTHFAAQLTNPQGGLANDRLTDPPASYAMPGAPRVLSHTTAAEMVELYWMALLRDSDLSNFAGDGLVGEAVTDINAAFGKALSEDSTVDRFILGSDIPGSSAAPAAFSPETIFRLGLPGDEVGPMTSQFFLRPAIFGTQSIDQRQRPYKEGRDYLTAFDDWLWTQNSGRDSDGLAYSGSNQATDDQYEIDHRYICTMRDLARFVNKDALHQAYFNAALILLSGGAAWGTGNPYHDLHNGVDRGPLPGREAGFGVLGGPHILALVSEVATRALKVVWQQKWQQHLRLRPEAYGGLLHVQNVGIAAGKRGTVRKRDYRLPEWVKDTEAAKRIMAMNDGGLLLPMAFSAGSPTHPAYGAGHATVAGACVTVLKAYFHTYTTDSNGIDHLVPFEDLNEPAAPYGEAPGIAAWQSDKNVANGDNRKPLAADVAATLTIEGELNKLAQNVAMGRSMGGVHWRTDNTRSLALGEALAARMLADIARDANEKPSFTFRTFGRGQNGNPKHVRIVDGKIAVDGVELTHPVSRL